MSRGSKRLAELAAAHRLQKLVEDPPEVTPPQGPTEKDIRRWLEDPSFWDPEQRKAIAKALKEFYESRGA